jgi:thiamine biosynthesis lipoprotein
MGIQWQAWGTTVRLEVTDPAAAGSATRILRRTLLDAERAADADRAGSEIHRLLTSDGRVRSVRPVLSALIATALDAAEQSAGLVDPTVGAATIPLRRALGRDHDHVAPRRGGTFPVCGAYPVTRPRPATGWRGVSWNERHVAVPAATALDLTATAKARTARLTASRIAERLGVGAVVEIGGDVAAAGPGPANGWLVQPQHLDGTTLEVPPGTALAVCRAAGIVDPASGRQVTGPWAAVAVAAPDVVLAKTAAVAALIHGDDAEEYLDQAGLAAVFLPHPQPHPSSRRAAGHS